MSSTTNPFLAMQKCGARTRAGTPCQRVGNHRNHRCRLHGGNSGGPSGPKNGRFRHGNRAQATKAQLQAIRKLLKEANELLQREG